MPPEGDLRRGEGVGLVDGVTEATLQGQGFRSEGAGGGDGAGVFAAQGLKAGGGQWTLLAPDALHFADPGIGIQLGEGEKLIAGLFDVVFHSQPVQQRALGLLLASPEFN